MHVYCLYICTGKPQRYFEFDSKPPQNNKYHNRVKQMFWFPTAYKRLPLVVQTVKNLPAI